MSIGHNNPPAPSAVYAERLNLYREHAASLGPVTEETAGAYRDAIGYGGELGKEIDGQRDAEKRPHLEAGRAIDATYKPLVAGCEAIRTSLRSTLQAWMNEREREARRIADEKARALREAEEAARSTAAALEPDDADDPFLAATAPDLNAVAADAKDAEIEAKLAARVGSEAGGFNALGLKTRRKAVVVNSELLALHYLHAGNRELLALLDKLANADVRHAKGSPLALPGVDIVEERVL